MGKFKMESIRGFGESSQEEKIRYLKNDIC